LAKDIAQTTPKSIVLLFPICVSALFEEKNLECSPLGFVEKVVLECKSLSERSVDPALRGFCDFLENSQLIELYPFNFLIKTAPRLWRGALQFGFFNKPFR
jgi:hypothetical protein